LWFKLIKMEDVIVDEDDMRILNFREEEEK
jgi:hypothetical protein